MLSNVIFQHNKLPSVSTITFLHITQKQISHKNLGRGCNLLKVQMLKSGSDLIRTLLLQLFGEGIGLSEL